MWEQKREERRNDDDAFWCRRVSPPFRMKKRPQKMRILFMLCHRAAQCVDKLLSFGDQRMKGSLIGVPLTTIFAHVFVF